MQDLRNLFNQALSAVGGDPSVTDPEAPGKATALLQLWFPVARHAVLTAAHWSSVRSTKRLPLLVERDLDVDWGNSDPLPGYRFVYQLPSDMLQPQYLADYSRFELSRVNGTQVLSTNTAGAILRYTADEPVPASWEPDLYRCIVWALAASINMSKSGKMAVTQKLENQTLEIISQAAVNIANGQDTYSDSIPSFYAGTGFSFPGQTARYYYPTSTFSLGGI